MTKTRNHKHVKKYLLLKRFEDEELNPSLTARQKKVRETLMVKY